MTEQERAFWLEHFYPVTIVADRYGGTYAGGKYVAYPLEYHDVPEEAHGDDMAAMALFYMDDAPLRGVGHSPNAAFSDLIRRVRAGEGATPATGEAGGGE
jgi:hypothetical protein